LQTRNYSKTRYCGHLVSRLWRVWSQPHLRVGLFSPMGVDGQWWNGKQMSDGYCWIEYGCQRVTLWCILIDGHGLFCKVQGKWKRGAKGGGHHLYMMENIEVEMGQGTARDFRAGKKLSSKNNGSKVSFFLLFK